MAGIFVTLSWRHVQLRASMPLQSDFGIRLFWGSARYKPMLWAKRGSGAGRLHEFWIVRTCTIYPFRLIYGCWDFEILHLFNLQRVRWLGWQRNWSTSHKIHKSLACRVAFSCSITHIMSKKHFNFNPHLAEAYSESTAVAVEATAGDHW